MSRLLIFCVLLLLGDSAFGQKHFDVVIVGANPGGIMAAVSAAKLGKKVLMLERTNHIGGLPANGLGATDIDTRAATTGLFLEFVQRIKSKYVEKYGMQSQQVRDCQDGYHFEPLVAEKVFLEMIREQSGITVLTRRQFDAKAVNVVLKNNSIQSIYVSNRDTKRKEHYSGSIFIDATYEGDLAAASGAPYRVGREDKKEYKEIGAGKIYKYWDGTEVAELSTQRGDTCIQAFNYRINLTTEKDNFVAITKPKHYNPEEYRSLVGDVLNNRQQAIGPMKTGINVLVNPVKIPNGKVDANNQHAALISTDLPEENWAWPNATWAWRDRFAERLRSYTLGLLYFAATDPALPVTFRNAVKEWGLAKDAYTDNGNFPRQVYVREGRRIVGLHVFTANDALPVEGQERPPLYASSITAGHYSLDSHATRKRENGKPVLEGFLSYKTKPYTVPLEVIIPRKVTNLLCPVPVSGTHIGFSTLRMEPCWMAIGQAAGLASVLMIENKCLAKDLPIQRLQNLLLDQKATLIYFEDVKIADPDFKMVQVLGLKGYLPAYRAGLSDVADEQLIKLWEKKSGVDLKRDSGMSKGALLRQIYNKYTQSN